MRTGGLVDLQVNGYAGVDFNCAKINGSALDHALQAMLAAGVTACLPTLITAPEPVLAARLHALDQAVAESRLGSLMVPGFHLEGPFLSPEPGYAGCHPLDAMISPDPSVIERLGKGLRRPILLLTLAPERPGALALIRWARENGMTVAIGHSAADDVVVAEAAGAGATLSTHLGNAVPHLLPKFANPLIAQLAEDRMTASFIADGVHVPPAALKVMFRAKGAGRTVLVTDATAAAAAAPGVYELAGMAIEHAADGSVRVPGSVMLAGSALRLDQAVRNVIAWELATPIEAIRLASDNPTAVLAPALAASGACLASATVEWSGAMHAVKVRLNDMSFRFG
jgi:N-acetylglucosamine-6-phosphate deacetylase